MNSIQNIIALSTPPGLSAIAVIRLSGPDVVPLTNLFFRSKNLTKQASHMLSFGRLTDSAGKFIDEVVISLFKKPQSYTGEDVVEISCHGSPYIINLIIELFLETGNIRHARPGEFTQRAFLNGKLNLMEAEAIADLIAADNPFQHQAALKQLRSGFAQELIDLRKNLIHFASLLELELDFSEEDVTFADRASLKILIEKAKHQVSKLIKSFKQGKVIKQGVSVALVGKPNAGKSTLLNALVEDSKAIVSDLPGTTRDLIEEQILIEGLTFRFIDTAGLRETEDTIECLGIERTKQAIDKADLVIYIYDICKTELEDAELENLKRLSKPLLVVANKIDLCSRVKPSEIGISAKNKIGLENLKQILVQKMHADKPNIQNPLVTRTRHYEGLKGVLKTLQLVAQNLDAEVSSDLLALDIRNTLQALSELTGDITNETVLDKIFRDFCIGK